MNQLPDTNNTASLLMALLADRTIPAESLGDADWERLITLAQQQFVAPMLYIQLRQRNIKPPPGMAERLYRIYNASLSRNMRLFHELSKIVNAMKAANIPIVPLKGAYLAEAVYDNIALRSMDDLDLWAPGQQFDSVSAVMRTLGYDLDSRMSRPQALQEAFGGEIAFFKPNSPPVELHWNIFVGEWFRITAKIDEAGVRQRSLPLDGETVRQLSPEDTIIHLCVHLAVNHEFSEIAFRSLLDLEFMRRKLSIDWKIVAQRARAWRVSCATWLVLQILGEFFGYHEGQLPLLDLAPSLLRQRLLRRIISMRNLMNGKNIGNGPKRFLFQLILVDRPSDACMLVWRALFPELLWLKMRYGLEEAPLWRIWLQRLWHPFRLVIKKEV